ncbi:MAG: hypothetical protein Q9M09_03585, partial [Mariprofundaceae bacterium]|nr:hypothetical protein [Mariprofundaceae bacterium]
MENKDLNTDPLAEEDAMQALRELIVGPEKEKIVELEQHISDAAHPIATVDDIARALPEAIRLRISQDKNLQRALQPVMEQSIQESVLNNPKPLSEALFPIMGPAIRKSINHTLNSMLQSMNQALENSFSIQGLRWRWEAKKSEKSFAEIVMLHTLEYRVEQVFVIHRESGLLINHLAIDAQMEEDADLVSSMLTAVRDFVRDSFAQDGKDEIDNLGMGELEVLIGQSPHVTLAVVCRGNIPKELYRMIDEHLEDVQKEYAHNLANFNGDNSLFVGIKDMLRDLMVADYKIKEERKRKPIRALLMITAAMLPLLGWWGWATYQHHLWLTFIQQLRQTAGIAVLNESKEKGHFVVYGLLDPLANEPLTLIPKHLPLKKIEMHWRPYYALEDGIILKRAAHLLKPIAETTLSFDSGMLTVRGAAHEPWIRDIAARALMVPGILQADIQLRDMDIEPLAHKVQRLLAPPETIQLTLNATDLTAQGEALQAWQETASEAAKTISALSNYDDSAVMVVDSPLYLLAQAQLLLQPPSSVHLTVDKHRVLFARGQALRAWAKSAREKATGIPYLAA